MGFQGIFMGYYPLVSDIDATHKHGKIRGWWILYKHKSPLPVSYHRKTICTFMIIYVQSQNKELFPDTLW